MKTKPNILCIILLLFVCCSTAFPYSTCTTGRSWGDGKPPCRQYKKYDFIAFGTVTKSEIIKTDEDKKYINTGKQIIDFKVEESFKGFSAKTIQLKKEFNTCNSPFKVGEKFIVYTNDLTSYKIDRFTKSDDDDFKVELEYLQFTKKEPAGATISGQLVNVYRKSIDDFYDIYSGLKDIEVLIKSVKSEYKVKTNKDGKFLLYGLDKGKYEISLGIFNWKGEQLTRTLDLNSDSCESVSGFKYKQGYIKGILLNPNGEFAANIELELIAIDPKTNQPTEDTLSRKTDENGEFFFDYIPEGKYLLAHNNDEDKLDKKIYPRLFFPGVKEFNSSSIIEIKNKQNIDLGVFRLISDSTNQIKTNEQ